MLNSGATAIQQVSRTYFFKKKNGIRAVNACHVIIINILPFVMLTYLHLYDLGIIVTRRTPATRYTICFWGTRTLHH